MDGSEKIESDDVVIIVENEAESKRDDQDQGSVRMMMMALMDVCPVCKLSFSSREPKLLPCLHSFCKRCLPAHNTPASTASNVKQCKSCFHFYSFTDALYTHMTNRSGSS